MSPDPDRPAQLPPGQHLAEEFPVLHYGPVPKFRPDSWNLVISGATADGQRHSLTMTEFQQLPQGEVSADMHCARKWSTPGQRWRGVLGADIVQRVPPAAEVSHVMVWAEYGYSATIRLKDLVGEQTIFATHLNGEPLPPERGYPLRLIVGHLYAWKGPKWLREIEYLTEVRRGFWEERGYHIIGDPWQEQRYSYQE